MIILPKVNSGLLLCQLGYPNNIFDFSLFHNLHYANVVHHEIITTVRIGYMHIQMHSLLYDEYAQLTV